MWIRFRLATEDMIDKMTVVTDSCGIISGQSGPHLGLEIIQTLHRIRATCNSGNNEVAVILMDPYYQHNIDNKTSFKFDSVLCSHWLEFLNPGPLIGPDDRDGGGSVRVRLILSKILFSCNKTE